MRQMLGLFYTVLFLSYIFAALFIVFHIVRYSFDKKTAVFGATLFLVVLVILLFTNALLFFSLPFDTVLSHTVSSF